MIDIQNLSFAYKNHIILDKVCFHISRGCCTGIIGANGCGKSTLLSILAGTQKAAGTMVLLKENNKDIDYPLSKLLRPDGIGYVPQENPLLEDLSGKDNLFLWYKKGKTEFQNALSSPMIQMLQLDSFLLKPVRQLSGGMKKRLSLAIGLINQPSLLILDEPSAALDIPCKYDIYNYLTEYMQQGGTVLITTHEAEELSLCQQLYVLKNGGLANVEASLRGKDLIKYF